MAAPAKAGAIAPVDVFIPPQNTGLGPEKMSFFQALAIPTKISRGTIEILVRYLFVRLLSATSEQFTKNYCIPTSKAIKTYCSALFPSWSIIEQDFFFPTRRISQRGNYFKRLWSYVPQKSVTRLYQIFIPLQAYSFHGDWYMFQDSRRCLMLTTLRLFNL